uniref:Uncharacterized protein n=1 Tax=Arundo donax TaxID=35708 RepID=A0A0A8ZIQ6_ARUDO
MIARNPDSQKSIFEALKI